VVCNNIGRCKLRTPRHLQARVIPRIIQGIDVLVSARPGSGTTLAYLAPIASALVGASFPPAQATPATRTAPASPRALVLAPTREVANQIFLLCRKLVWETRLRPALVTSALTVEDQISHLSACDVLVATTGRLLGVIRDYGHIALDRVRRTAQLDAYRSIWRLGTRAPPRYRSCRLHFS
jgi:superfamily II DNA/RNA helicase